MPEAAPRSPAPGWLRRVLLGRTRFRTPQPADPLHGLATAPELQAFVSATVHELRTPLTALAGELELALRRPQSERAYRECLERVAASVAELTSLTADLAVLGAGADDLEEPRERVSLDAVLTRAIADYAEAAVIVDGVVGREIIAVPAGATRALQLLVRHAVKYRQPGSRVTVRTQVEDDKWISVRLQADPSGFRPGAWLHLTPRAASSDPAPRELRLRVASRLLAASGGAISHTGEGGTEAVTVRLCCAGGACQ